MVYAIETRPAGAGESHVTLAADGTLSVLPAAVFADSGEYRIGTTGTGDYAGSKTVTINIDIEDHSDDAQSATPVNPTSSNRGPN